jgi:hypothetical protein
MSSSLFNALDAGRAARALEGSQAAYLTAGLLCETRPRPRTPHPPARRLAPGYGWVYGGAAPLEAPPGVTAGPAITDSSAACSARRPAPPCLLPQEGR